MLRTRRAWLLPLALLLVLVAAGGAVTLLATSAGEEATPRGTHLVFAEFGARADRIFTAPASDPSRRTLITTVDHANEWGLNPALAPAGTLVAFTVLAPASRPQPDSPADLWILDLGTKAKRRVAGDADLRVPPVLDRDGRYLLYRTSAAGGQQTLVRLEVATGARRPLLNVETAFGVFPIGFAADGSVLYAAISTRGTDLYRLVDGQPPARLFRTSDQVSREWTLSPDGKALAFIAPELTPERVRSRLHVIRLEGANATPISAVTEPGAPSEYGVAWRPSGDAITVGREVVGDQRAAAVTVPLAGGARVALPPPPRGFDRPLLWSADGKALVAQSFEGASAAAPGEASTVIIAEGERRPVTGTGDIVVFGWIEHA